MRKYVLHFAMSLAYLTNSLYSFPITDVIGYVTAISNVRKVFSGNKLQLRRNITIKDRNGDSLQVSLIGQRAMEFPEQMVLKIKWS